MDIKHWLQHHWHVQYTTFITKILKTSLQRTVILKPRGLGCFTSKYWYNITAPSDMFSARTEIFHHFLQLYNSTKMPVTDCNFIGCFIMYVFLMFINYHMFYLLVIQLLFLSHRVLLSVRYCKTMFIYFRTAKLFCRHFFRVRCWLILDYWMSKKNYTEKLFKSY